MKEMTNRKTKTDTRINQTKNRDHPEQYKTDTPSILDRFEAEQHVDPIPMEDLRMEQKEEKNKTATKHDSSSPHKYHSGFDH
jgi:hypothetical protein